MLVSVWPGSRAALFAESIIAPQPGEEMRPIHGATEILSDAGGTLDAARIAALGADRFQSGFERPPRIPRGPDSLWIRFKLVNSEPANRWILDQNRSRSIAAKTIST